MKDIYDFYITPGEYEEAQKNGICRKLLDARIRNLGWDKDIAITKKPNYNKELKIYIEIAKENGIKETTFLKRIRRLNWDIDRASTEKVRSRKECADLIGGSNRKYPKEIYEELKKNGIARETFRVRMLKGWSLEEASTRKPMTKKESSALGNAAYKEKYGHSFGFDFGMSSKVRIWL